MRSNHPPVRVFISYSHRDEDLRREMDTHLRGLQRQGLVEVWHDRKINPGEEWAGRIDEELGRSQIIVLLISADFIASDYCHEIEMTRALKMHEAGVARVVPVILRDCYWEGEAFSKLQALPSEAKALTNWPNRDSAWLDVVRGIVRAIRQLDAPASALPPDAPPPLPSTNTTPGMMVDAAVSDSGNLMLLGDRIYVVEQLTEEARNNLTVRVLPQNSEDDAALRDGSNDPRGGQRGISFAYGDQGGFAQILNGKRTVQNGAAHWELKLQVKGQEGYLDDIAYNSYSANDLALIRAELLLLDKKPPRSRGMGGSIDSAFMLGTLTKLGIDEGLFSRMWRDNRLDNQSEWLRQARLAAVFFLVASNVCEHILELTLGPIASGELPVRFRGSRRRQYSNVEPAIIRVQGACRLD